MPTTENIAGYADLNELHRAPASADGYLAALHTIWNQVNQRSVLLLLDAMLELGGEGGAVQLAKKAFGKPNDIVASGVIGRLGHQVADALGVREQGKANWFSAIATGRTKNREFHWHLHNTFIEALRRFPPTSALEGWAGMKRGPDEVTVESAAVGQSYHEAALPELILKYEQTFGHNNRPPQIPALTWQLERSALVIAIARKQANFRCEVPGCSHAPFVAMDGIAYTEVHHIKPLASGGADVLENVACVCPSHHREAHHGRNSEALTNALLAMRASK